MPKSVNEIAHDIAVSILPKALDDLEQRIYTENGHGEFDLNSEMILDTYTEIHKKLAEGIKETNGINHKLW